MTDYLKIDSVFLDFGNKKVLRGANLRVESKQIIGILGRNGSGKSCFLKIITGQLDPQFKHISYNDTRSVNLYKKRGLINYLPQHEFHPKSLTVKELLKYYEIEKNTFMDRHQFIKDQANKRFSELSGGMKRVLEVLLVLESKSKFTILDEPFSHIMPVYIDVVKESIKRMKKEKGILITDHQYRNVISISDQIYLLKEGILQQVASEIELREKGYIG